MSLRINSKDITVIVQGHVRGKPNDPESERWTNLSLLSVRQFLPDSQLILSTFEECDVNNLAFDTLVLSKDPGHLDLGERNQLVGNTNRQIVSTCAGIAKAERKYILKMRYDLVLKGNNFLDYFARFNERCPEWKIFKQRLVSCTSVSLNPRKVTTVPLAPSDWFHFGLREDIANLWNVALIPEAKMELNHSNPQKTNYNYQAAHQYSAEQYLWIYFLRKYGVIDCSHVNDVTPNTINLTELTIVNNLVLLEPNQIPIQCMKYQNPNFLTYSKQFNYTHAEWLKLYEKFCLQRYAGNNNRIRITNISKLTEPKCSTKDRLYLLGTEILKKAVDINFNNLRHLFDSQVLNTIETFPGETYKHIAKLINITQPQLAVEFNSGNCLRALCMRSQMQKNNYLVSINCAAQRNTQHAAPLNRYKKDDKLLTLLNLDISLPNLLKKIIFTVAQADIIIFNLDDGIQLKTIIDCIKKEKPKKDIILGISGINNWSISEIWNTLPSPKLDISTFGHPDGFGIHTIQNNS